MAKKQQVQHNGDTEPIEIVEGFVPTRLRSNSRYGRVMIGSVIVERTGIALLTPEQYEQHAEDYDLEIVGAE